MESDQVLSTAAPPSHGLALALFAAPIVVALAGLAGPDYSQVYKKRSSAQTVDAECVIADAVFVGLNRPAPRSKR